MEWASMAGWSIAWLGVAALCLAGIAASACSWSGTWLVLGATAIAGFLPGSGGFSGLLILGFAGLCGAVEAVETLAVSWGVLSRGGSKRAAWAGLLGSLIGAMTGGMLIPVPLIGSLLGIFAGSFGLVLWVEYRRLRHGPSAARVAVGAVMARVLVLIMKLGVTLLMVGILAVRVLRHRGG